MPKRKKPYPKFIVSTRNGTHFTKTTSSLMTIKEKLSMVYYTHNTSEFFFYKNVDFEAQLLQFGFRRPTQTELLLFEKE